MASQLVQIETGAELGKVYVNPDHVTHIHKNMAEKGDGFSVAWLTNGKVLTIQGSPEEVYRKLFPLRP